MDRRDPLERIAAALERLAPPPAPPTDWLSAPAYVWEGERARAVPALDALPLDNLHGIDAQKTALRANFARLAAGAAAHDALLWGARGMGKSALVRAAVADVQGQAPGALALVQLAPGTLPSFPTLIAQLAEQPRAVVLFIDDLGFGADGRAAMLALRSLLDGGVAPRPPQIRLAVTANRRAIVERADTSAAIHERDERDDALALADRFGLSLGFHPADKDTYLAILEGYTAPLGLSFDAEEALAFAIQRGNRSGRTALQFATDLAGRAGVWL
ncbi:MAG: ATPase [Alphaproteobacteria bacterium HGW-Alphaproteobacteria-16]|nr:MAG: ATPase [Alphaproteobacteria bacterium HGW-Alphaproteobacteria-16]